MDRSPGFGSTHSDLTPYSDSVSLRLPYSVKLATASNSLTHYTKGTQSLRLRIAPTACTHTVSGSISLPSPGFFSPFPHGTGSLSVSKEYLALEDGPPIFKQDFTCPDLLVVTHLIIPFRLRGYHPLWLTFPDHSTKTYNAFSNRAVPLSLATTSGISVDFFSSRYLDVSVPRVRFIHLCIQSRMIRSLRSWVSPFRHLRIKACCQLPEAFRRLPRLSSPLTAKASTICAYSLDHITPNSL